MGKRWWLMEKNGLVSRKEGAVESTVPSIKSVNECIFLKRRRRRKKWNQIRTKKG
jgi:hypothetical protein